MAVGKSLQTKKTPVKRDYPPYKEMIQAAYQKIDNSGKGVSLSGLLGFIMENYKVGTNSKIVNTRLKFTLRNMIKTGAVKNAVKGKAGFTGRLQLVSKKAVVDKPKKVKQHTAAVKVSKKTVKKSPAKPKKAIKTPKVKGATTAKARKPSVTKKAVRKSNVAKTKAVMKGKTLKK